MCNGETDSFFFNHRVSFTQMTMMLRDRSRVSIDWERGGEANLFPSAIARISE